MKDVVDLVVVILFVVDGEVVEVKVVLGLEFVVVVVVLVVLEWTFKWSLE